MPCLRSQRLHSSSPDGDFQHSCIAVCFRKRFPRISTSQKAVMISLAYLSFWSAERIVQVTIQNCPHDDGKPVSRKSAAISAEDVWDLCMAWYEHLPFCPSNLGDMVKGMHRIIHQFKFNTSALPKKVRNLTTTPRPKTFPYAKLWLPTERYSTKVIPSFIPKDGVDNFKTCMKLGETGPLTCFTPAERGVIDQFGPHVLPMMRKILNECMEYLERDMMTGEFNRNIFDLTRHLNQIMRLGNRAIELWCDVFGSIDHDTTSWSVGYRKTDEFESGSHEGIATQLRPYEIPKRRPRNETATKQGKCVLYLNSGPEAIKMFIICIVTDRIRALHELRVNRRQAIGVTSVSVEDLPSNGKECPICRETLGVRNEQGEFECPVRLVSCCGQFSGERCLQKWFRYSQDKNCPLCRQRPSPSFFEKLFEGKSPSGSPASEGDIVELSGDWDHVIQ